MGHVQCQRRQKSQASTAPRYRTIVKSQFQSSVLSGRLVTQLLLLFWGRARFTKYLTITLLYDNCKINHRPTISQVENLGQTCDRSYDNLRTNLKLFCKSGPWFLLALMNHKCAKSQFYHFSTDCTFVLLVPADWLRFLSCVVGVDRSRRLMAQMRGLAKEVPSGGLDDKK